MYQYLTPFFVLTYVYLATADDLEGLGADVLADSMPDDNSTTPEDTPAFNMTPEAVPEAPEAVPEEVDTPDEAPVINGTVPEETPEEAPTTNVTVPEEEEAPTTNVTTPEEGEAPTTNGTTPGDAPATTPEEGKVPATVPEEGKTPVAVPSVTPQDATPSVTLPVVIPDPPLKWCGTNRSCQALGDTEASCNEAFECECSQGFGSVTEGNVTAYICARTDGVVSRVVKVVLSLVFNIDCNSFSDNLRGPLIQVVENAVGGTVRNLQTRCGSLIAVSEVDGVDPIKLATTDVTAAVNTQIDDPQFSALKEVVGSVTSSSSEVGGSACTVDNADSTFELPSGDCVALSCLEGFTLRQEACVVQTATVVSGDDDDDLTAGQTAGIVVGVLAGVGLIAAVLYFVLCGNSASDVPAGDTAGPTADHDPSHEPVTGDAV